MLPVLSFVLLYGFPAIGLVAVPTTLWGGVLVTIVVAAVGIVASLPIGILLALGRRSDLPAVRLFAVIFIEFVRGVPLITVLFMASVMLPLFVPERLEPDKLLRALIGVALFASAYMAEVVRGGLAAMPRGQYEAARALGLGYWRMMGLVILPQALRVTLPNIVNTFIGLFKDTTLVFVVGIFDFLRTIEAARGDPRWATPTTAATGYVFAALFYFVCCYGMSRYATARGSALARAGRHKLKARRRMEQPAHGNHAPSPAARPAVQIDRPAQMVRRIPCAARHQPGSRARRTHRHLRPVRRRQVDAAALHQPAGGLAARPHRRRRHRIDRRLRKQIVAVRRDVGMVFQQFNLFPHLTVLENCTLAPIWVRHMPKRDAEELAMIYLARVKIPEQARQIPGAVVRRPAAAGGDRARAVHEPENHAV